MKKDNSNKKCNIYEEYISHYDRFQKKYGSKSIVLMQVGSFHEAYSTDNKGQKFISIK